MMKIWSCWLSLIDLEEIDKGSLVVLVPVAIQCHPRMNRCVGLDRLRPRVSLKVNGYQKPRLC